MVEEDHLLKAARIGFAVVREFQHHLGKAMRIAGKIQAEAVSLNLLDADDAVECRCDGEHEN